MKHKTRWEYHETMSDAQAISAVLRGDTGRFEELVEHYLPMVRGLCASRLHDPDTVDDLVQDVFLGCFRDLNKLRNPARFGPWLAALTRNRCKMHVRGKVRRQAAHQSFKQASTEVCRQDPAQEASRRELFQWVRTTIGHLPQKTRDAMVLHYVEGFTIPEAAAALGVRQSAIKKRLEYGRRLVGDRLWDGLGPEAERKQPTDTARKRIIAALPLAAAPWAARTASAATALTPALALKSVAILAAVGAIAVFAWSRLDGPDGTTPSTTTAAAALAAQDSTGGMPPEGGAIGAQAAASEPGTNAPAAEAEVGGISLSIHYKTWEHVDPVTPESGPMSGGFRRREVDSGEPVPNAEVRAIPIRFNDAAFAALMREAEVEEERYPVFRAVLAREATGEGGLRKVMDDAGVDPASFRETWRGFMERLHGLDAELDIEKKMAGLRSLAPEESWVQCRASLDGQATLAGLAPGNYLLYIRDPLVADTWPEPDAARVLHGPGFVDRGIVCAPGVARPNETFETTVIMEDAASSIRGTVIDAVTGEPVPNVTITITGEATQGMAQHESTNERGQFNAVPIDYVYGTFDLHCESRTHVDTTVQGERVLGQRCELTVKMQGNATVSGFVRNPDGSPAPGVSIYEWDENSGTGRTRTDESGHYACPHNGGQIVLSAGSCGTRSEKATLVLEPGENAEHDFVLPSSGTIALDVRGAWRGIPEKLETARVFHQGDYRYECTGVTPVRSGDQYIVRYLAPGTYDFSFAVEGYEAVLLKSLMVRPDRTTGPIAVKLQRPSSRLLVRLLDESGAPIRDAGISLAWVFYSYNRQGERSGHTWQSIETFGLKTDRNGEYAFEGLPPGLYEVTAVGNKVEVEVPTPTPLVLHKKEKPKPTSLRAQVTAFDAADNNAPIRVTDAKVFTLTPSGELSQGKVEEGENLIVWVAEGHPAAFGQVVVTAKMLEEFEYAINVPLSVGQGGSVYGQLLDKEGEPAAYTHVGILPTQFFGQNTPNLGHYRWRGLAYALARDVKTDANGDFVIDLLPEGEYVICRGNTFSEPFSILPGHETGQIVVAGE
jgi:RNA polymerase sigma factor (sigma-70 family)